jgi:hypothetical protein
MTRLSATERQLFDLFNASPWDTDTLRIDQAVECLVSRGMKRADAEIIAADAYAQWVAATKIAGPC